MISFICVAATPLTWFATVFQRRRRGGTGDTGGVNGVGEPGEVDSDDGADGVGAAGGISLDAETACY